MSANIVCLAEECSDWRNSTLTHLLYCRYTPGTAGTIAVVLVIISAILLGNGLIITAVFYSDHLRRNKQNTFIVSLAVSDFLVGLLIMPVSLVYEILGCWTFGSFLCELWLALDVLFVTASIMNLCLISIDRYLSISHPITYNAWRSKLRVLLLVFFVWLLALVVSLPPLLFQQERAVGTCLLSRDPGYVLYSAAGSFYIPFGVLIIIYIRLHRYARSRRKRREQSVNAISVRMRQVTPNVQTGLQTTVPQQYRRLVRRGKHPLCREEPRKKVSIVVASAPPIVHTQSPLVESNGVITEEPDTITLVLPEKIQYTEERRRTISVSSVAVRCQQRCRVIRRQGLRNTITMIIIVTAFICCWQPFFTLYVIQAVCGTCHIPNVLFDVAFWLGYCNSALNPVIYSLFNPQFRNVFKRILSCS